MGAASLTVIPNPMNKADEYLQRAVECVEMAKQAKSDQERQKVLQIAQAWRELAETGMVMPPEVERTKP